MDLEEDQKRCCERLNWAIAQLGGNPTPSLIARIAGLVIQTMTGPWRFFHTPEHIFEVGESGDAVEVLAALFHDLVYVQVDQGISVNISAFISPFVKEVNGQLVIRDRDDLPDDLMFELMLGVFGFHPGQGLIPTAGQNEFLSAVIGAKCLQPALPLGSIAEIASCIEATIPFRGRAEDGSAPGERLHRRLEAVNQTYSLGWSTAKIDAIVKRAIRLANRDVENFAYPASADFLDNTWNLLPETNHDLANANSYTVYGYRMSLQKMEGFMYFLKPELVFQRFQNEPEEAVYQQLVERTGRNLDVARLYLGSKLLSIAVVEALSRRIGRDIPLATMMGELPSFGVTTAQLENFLPIVDVMPYPPETDLEWEVLSLLEKGRSQSSSYDIKNSPVATYLIKSLGFKASRELLKEAKAFFKGDLTAEEFLQCCDRSVLEPIVSGVAKVFASRQEAVQRERISSQVHS